MNSLDKKYRRIIKLDNNLAFAMDDLCEELQKKTDFDISIQNLSGDGWCVMSEITGFPLNMKVESFIETAKNKERVTIDDWHPFN